MNIAGSNLFLYINSGDKATGESVGEEKWWGGTSSPRTSLWALHVLNAKRSSSKNVASLVESDIFRQSHGPVATNFLLCM